MIKKIIGSTNRFPMKQTRFATRAAPMFLHCDKRKYPPLDRNMMKKSAVWDMDRFPG
jgi:hypothetical protein